MPTYEYRCPKGHEFEQFQRMSDPPEAPCPECGETAERLLSAGAGLIFKGSGFYITDYRSESYRKQAEAEARKPFDEFDPKSKFSSKKDGDGAPASGKSEKKSPESAGSKAAAS